MPQNVAVTLRVFALVIVVAGCEKPEAKAERLRTELTNAEMELRGLERMYRGVEPGHVNYNLMVVRLDSATAKRDVAQRNYNKFMSGR